MIDHLILSLKDYKTQIDYKNVDFNSDVVAMCSKLRECMALAFDTEYVGPIDLPIQEESDSQLSKEEKKAFQTEVALAKSLIKKGYNRVKEKIQITLRSSLSLGVLFQASRRVNGASDINHSCSCFK